jgi:hypothetical protein
MRPRGQHGGGKRRLRRRALGTLFTSAALLVVVPASAQALGLTDLSAAPVNGQAGANSDFEIHMGFDGTGGGTQVKDLTVGLPPGLIGNPNATPKCTVEQLTAASCPANTQVGSVDATANILSLPLPVPASGSLYNLEPNLGEPARFGIVLNPFGLPIAPIVLQSGVQLRSDYGLNTVINNIPNKTLVDGDTTIISQDITLFGSRPWMSAPFMRNPTSCKQHTTTFSAVPHSGASDSGAANFTTDDCDALDFSPAFSALIGGAVGGQTTTVTTSIDQAATEAGLLKATVAIPPDLNPDLNLLANRCAPDAFQAGSCPSSSIMGFAIASSPLLTSALAGNVILVETGGIPEIGLDLRGQLNLKLRGTFGLDKVVTFDNLPDIPIASFALTFPSAPGLLTASRNLCEPPPPNFHAEFLGYNGATTAVDVLGVVVGACKPPAATKAKCKKAKKKKGKKRAAEAKKKKKKKKCKKKKRKKKR